jgi:hypothetical protein
LKKRAQFYHLHDELKDVNGQNLENHFETLALARSILQNMPVEPQCALDSMLRFAAVQALHKPGRVFDRWLIAVKSVRRMPWRNTKNWITSNFQRAI